MWAFFKNKKDHGFVERDDGYIELFEVNLCFSEYKHWPFYEKEALKYANVRVLDIGCGAGRHSIYLQKKGFDVTGIDNSPLAIKICKLRGLKKAKIMSITEIGKFKQNSFDMIIIMGNNFGLLGSPKKAKAILKKFHDISSGKALIIASCNDPYKTDKPEHLEYHEFNKKRGRMPGQVRIRVRFKKFIGEWFDYLYVSKNEMKKILKGTGWKIKKFIDSNKSYYIAVIEKE